VASKDPVRHRFYFVFSSETDYGLREGQNRMIIYECSDDAPPSRWTSSMEKLCTIHAQLEADYRNLEDYSGKNGCTLKRWNFELEMVPSGASSEFTVYYGGEKRGTQNVAIDFE
jgi:hypothetical protein